MNYPNNFPGESIRQHESAFISPLADLEASTRGSKFFIGAHSFIDSFVKFKPAGGSGDIIIGQNTYINSGCVLYSGNGISIGNYVLVAANCTFAPVNHSFIDLDVSIRDQGFMPSMGGILIEDNVWIGANCVFLDGAIVRSGCVVGAGSLIRGELPSNWVCYGTPAKPQKLRA